MKREIKFRGMALGNNKYHGIKRGDWVYGSFVKTDIDSPQILWGDGEQMEVNPETVGQFTGLKDSSGAEIFEGDILDQCEFPEDEACHYSVIFEDGAFRKNYPVWSPTLKKIILDSAEVILLDDVVIANIHDNPELLENNNER